MTSNDDGARSAEVTEQVGGVRVTSTVGAVVYCVGSGLAASFLVRMMLLRGKMMMMGLRRFTKYTNMPNIVGLRETITTKLVAENDYCF